MRISTPPFFHHEKAPNPAGAGVLARERFRICEVPRKGALLSPDGLADDIRADQFLPAGGGAPSLR
jgi:hypothetical protein